MPRPYYPNFITVVLTKAHVQFSANLGCTRPSRVVGPVEDDDVHKLAPERVRKNIEVFNLTSQLRIHLTLKQPCAVSKNNRALHGSMGCPPIHVILSFRRLGT